MKEYDVVVIGSGAGAIVVEQALSQGLKVALVDKGPLGGTCLNEGCIPTKMMIFPADRVVEIQEAAKQGKHLGFWGCHRQKDVQAFGEQGSQSRLAQQHTRRQD